MHTYAYNFVDPQREKVNLMEFKNYFLCHKAYVVKNLQNEILGSFYIKPNFPGRCSHICNAGFIVRKDVRGNGIGKFMGSQMLILAKQLGFEAVMYNLVFETNIASIKIWDSLGFKRIGIIPNAAYLSNGKCVNAIQFYYNLK